MAECKKLNIIGSNNPRNSEYTDTIADYLTSVDIEGDNTLIDVACDSSVQVGSVVYFDAALFRNAVANNYNSSKIVGVCTSKSDLTTCSIRVTGFTGDVFVGLNIADYYYLSDTVPGQIQNTPPTTTGSYVIKLGKAITSQNLIIQIERIVKRV